MAGARALHGDTRGELMGEMAAAEPPPSSHIPRTEVSLGEQASAVGKDERYMAECRATDEKVTPRKQTTWTPAAT